MFSVNLLLRSVISSTTKNILVPAFTWKIVVVLQPGEGIADVTANTPVIAVITPNRPSPNSSKDLSQYRLPATASYPNGFPQPNLTNVNNWEYWQQWRVDVKYLEELTNYDFLSNVPKKIQNMIEPDSSSNP